MAALVSSAPMDAPRNVLHQPPAPPNSFDKENGSALTHSESLITTHTINSPRGARASNLSTGHSFNQARANSEAHAQLQSKWEEHENSVDSDTEPQPTHSFHSNQKYSKQHHEHHYRSVRHLFHRTRRLISIDINHEPIQISATTPASPVCQKVDTQYRRNASFGREEVTAVKANPRSPRSISIRRGSRRFSSALTSALSGAAASLASLITARSSFDMKDLAFDLDEEDLLPGSSGRDKFMNEYTVHELKAMLDETETTSALATKGFQNLNLALDLTGLAVDKFRIYDMAIQKESTCESDNRLILQPPTADNILSYHADHENFTHLPVTSNGVKPPEWLPPLFEMAVRNRFEFDHSHAMTMAQQLQNGLKEKRINRITNKCAPDYDRTLQWMQLTGNVGLKYLAIEWVLMQNVTKKLDTDLLHALPGQEYPGLGIMQPMVDMLKRIAQGKDAAMNSPLYFHNALMYTRMPGCAFLNPEFEGQFRTLKYDMDVFIQDTEHFGLAVVSRALFYGNVIHKPSGRRIRWEAMEQIIPLTDRAKKTIAENAEYLEIVNANTTSGVFTIDLGHNASVENDLDTEACVLTLSDIDTRPAPVSNIAA